MRPIWRDVAAIAVAGVAARAVVVAVAGSWGTPQLWEYDAIARNMLAGRGFVYDYNETEYRAFTTPGWPVLLSLLLRIGDYRLVQSFLVLCSVLLGISVYLAVRGEWDRRTGLTAGLLCVLQPGIVYYSAINSDPLPLNALIVFLIAPAFLHMARRPGPRSALVAGSLVGASMLTRGTTVLLLPVGALWLWAVAGWRRAVPAIAIAAVVAVALVSPWLARNATTLDALVMTSTGGEMLWWGNNEEASGGIEALNGAPMRAGTPPHVRAVLRESPNELTHDAAFRQEALAFITGRPAAFAELTRRKFGHFWWFGPFYGRQYPAWFMRVYQPVYALQVALALAGVAIALASPQRAAACLLAAIPLAISIFQSLFYVQGRHRWMVESFMLVFVAVALVAGFDRFASASRGSR